MCLSLEGQGEAHQAGHLTMFLSRRAGARHTSRRVPRACSRSLFLLYLKALQNLIVALAPGSATGHHGVLP